MWLHHTPSTLKAGLSSAPASTARRPVAVPARKASCRRPGAKEGAVLRLVVPAPLVDDAGTGRRTGDVELPAEAGALALAPYTCVSSSWEERVESKWLTACQCHFAHHNLATQLPGARQADFECERTILEAGALVAVPSTVFTLIHTKCWSTRPFRA
jgi:hypothetical protein